MTAMDRELGATLTLLGQSLDSLSMSSDQEQGTAGDNQQAGHSSGTAVVLSEVRRAFEAERRTWHASDSDVQVPLPGSAGAWSQRLLDLRMESDASAATLAGLVSAAK